MAILITGGAGYIGSHTAVLLATQGEEVVVIDNLSNSYLEAISRVEKLSGTKIAFYQIDLAQAQPVREVFNRHKISGVIHFAGHKAVGESVESPLKYYSNNLGSTLVLCQEMCRAGVFNLVFSSSATVYGDPEHIPIKETDRLQATNPYGRTKLFIEEILRDLANAEKQTSIALLRYFNPVGAHPSGEIGENPLGMPNNLMPYLSKVALGKLAVLPIYGSDYPTVDGTGVRDYIHVMDLAKAHIAALEHCSNRRGAAAYNLGTGRGVSVLEMVQAFERITGVSIPYKIVERRPGDVACSLADPSRAEQELSWKAELGLEEMIRDTWHWLKKNPSGYLESSDNH